MPDRDETLASLLTRSGLDLPPGQIIVDDEVARPRFWLSDGPADAALWRTARDAHSRTGLWPLLVRDDDHAWSAHVLALEYTDPDGYDVGRLLAGWWRDYTAYDDENDHLSKDERAAVTSPYGDRWPGLSAPITGDDDADANAATYVEFLLDERPDMRLVLVPAGRSADALMACGWTGPANYISDTGQMAAVLRSWEDRFGARVIGAEGFGTMLMSVAAPPSTDHALPVAAEHFALCPDNIWQGARDETLASYANRIVDRYNWAFWWD